MMNNEIITTLSTFITIKTTSYSLFLAPLNPFRYNHITLEFNGAKISL